MSASAQRHDIRLRLNNLAAANPVTYQAPRPGTFVTPPVQPRIDQRRDALAAAIAQQLAGAQAAPTAPATPGIAPPAPAQRISFSRLFDVPTLIVSFAATGLLIGSALATMILSGAIDTPEAEPVPPPPVKQAVLSASTAGAAMPVTVQQSPPAEQPAQVAALPPQDIALPAEPDISAPEEGVGLFGDVREVYRGDGQEGVPFGALAPGAAVTPSQPAEAHAQPAPAAPAQPQTGEAQAEAKWIELSVSVNLRKGPSRSSGVIRVVEKGTKLEELERKNGWVKVTDPETKETGWLYPNSRPGSRRVARQPAPNGESKQTSSGPFASLGNLLGKSAAPSQPPPMR
jgi:Bacterial SH3 domain